MQWRMRSRYAQSKEERRRRSRLIRPDMKLYNVSHLCCIHSFVPLSFIKHYIHYTTVPPIPAILIGYGPLFSQNFFTVIQRKYLDLSSREHNKHSNQCSHAIRNTSLLNNK
jgi:hypothetical protein